MRSVPQSRFSSAILRSRRSSAGKRGARARRGRDLHLQTNRMLRDVARPEVGAGVIARALVSQDGFSGAATTDGPSKITRKLAVHARAI